MTARALVVTATLGVVLCSCATTRTNEVLCDAGDSLIISAQAVTSATMIPCIGAFPTGWTYGGLQAETGSVRFWLDSDRGGVHAVEVELSPDCDTSGASELDTAPGSATVERLERTTGEDTGRSGERLYVFDGGCVTMRYDFAEDADPGLLDEVEGSLTLVPRTLLVTTMQKDRSLILCGAGAPKCP